MEEPSDISDISRYLSSDWTKMELNVKYCIWIMEEGLFYVCFWVLMSPSAEYLPSRKNW